MASKNAQSDFIRHRFCASHAPNGPRSGRQPRDRGRQPRRGALVVRRAQAVLAARARVRRLGRVVGHRQGRGGGARAARRARGAARAAEGAAGRGQEGARGTGRQGVGARVRRDGRKGRRRGRRGDRRRARRDRRRRRECRRGGARAVPGVDRGQVRGPVQGQRRRRRQPDPRLRAARARDRRPRRDRVVAGRRSGHLRLRRILGLQVCPARPVRGAFAGAVQPQRARLAVHAAQHRHPAAGGGEAQPAGADRRADRRHRDRVGRRRGTRDRRRHGALDAVHRHRRRRMVPELGHGGDGAGGEHLGGRDAGASRGAGAAGRDRVRLVLLLGHPAQGGGDRKDGRQGRQGRVADHVRGLRVMSGLGPASARHLHDSPSVPRPPARVPRHGVPPARRQRGGNDPVAVRPDAARGADPAAHAVRRGRRRHLFRHLPPVRPDGRQHAQQRGRRAARARDGPRLRHVPPQLPGRRTKRRLDQQQRRGRGGRHPQRDPLHALLGRLRAAAAEKLCPVRVLLWRDGHRFRGPRILPPHPDLPLPHPSRPTQPDRGLALDLLPLRRPRQDHPLLGHARAEQRVAVPRPEAAPLRLGGRPGGELQAGPAAAAGQGAAAGGGGRGRGPLLVRGGGRDHGAGEAVAAGRGRVGRGAGQTGGGCAAVKCGGGFLGRLSYIGRLRMAAGGCGRN